MKRCSPSQSRIDLMKVGIKIKDDDEIVFDSYDEAMDYIEDLVPDIMGYIVNTDDIRIEYYGN